MKSVDETARLLSQAGVIDHRRPDEVALLAWHELLAPYALRDCLDALRAHRRESADYLQPAHIIGRVRAVQRRRALAVPFEANPDIERDYPAACRAIAEAVRNGVIDRDDYNRYVEGTVPADEFIRRVEARAVTAGRGRRELR